MGSHPTAAEILSLWCNTQGNILDDEAFIQQLSKFAAHISHDKPPDCDSEGSEELNAQLSSKLSEGEEMVSTMQGELGSVKTMLEKALQETQEIILRAQAEHENEQVANRKQSLEEQLTAANDKRTELLRASESCNARLTRCPLLRKDMKKVALCLKGCLAVTVLTKSDGDNTSVSCLNAAGEELMPAQPIDVTFGELRQAVSAVAPDVYISLLTSGGTLLSEDTPDSQLVRSML